LSQAALAQRAGVDLATVKAIERDRRRRPHLQTLTRLTEALGLAPAERDALLALASGETVPSIDAGGPNRQLADLRPLADFAQLSNMTIELHPNLCPPDLGLAAIGDIFVVGPDGGRRLTRYPLELQSVSPR
jgi:transcriptional regulator with XRE-family HTH domain